MLAVQGQVVNELVDQQTGQKTDVGQAALEHRARRRHLAEGGRRLVVHHRAAVLEHHVAARALRQAARDLVVDHLVLLGVRTGQLRRRQLDHLDRHLRRKPQALVADAGLIARLGHPAGVVDLLGRYVRSRRGGVAEQRLEPELAGLSTNRRSDFWPNSWRLSQVSCWVRDGSAGASRRSRRAAGRPEKRLILAQKQRLPWGVMIPHGPSPGVVKNA